LRILCRTGSSCIGSEYVKALRSFGKLTCLGGGIEEWERLRGQQFEVFIGGPCGFKKVAETCMISIKILLLSGIHPREKIHLVRSYAESILLPHDAVGFEDLRAIEEIEESIQAADYILCAGSMADCVTYVKHGVPWQKIKPMLSGIPRLAASPPPDRQGDRAKVYTFAERDIGAESGFDTVFHLFSDPDVTRQNLRLNVVGRPVNPYFVNRVEQLKQYLGGKLHIWGDAAPHSAKWAEICKESDFIVSPAFGGGQNPYVLSAVSCGAIPVLSKHAGFEFSPFGYLEDGYRLNNKHLMLSTLQLQPDELLMWKRKSAGYYEEYHKDYVQKWEKAVRDCINGSLYPKISVTLPVFNKQDSIASLLYGLHSALTAYGNAELHIILDGCADRSEEVIRGFFAGRPVSYSITYDVTPNLFEVKTNNIGLRKSTGEYGVILQDDNYVLDPYVFHEVVQFMERNRKCAVVGCLSGVNFYPRGTMLHGSGQIACTENEVYWRQDEKTNPGLKHRIFEVDACMRGPLVIRKSFLEQHGYLDEVYAPLYQDDMDLCFRARHFGYKVYCIMCKVENRSLTMAHYDYQKGLFFQTVMKKNTDIFYSRWTPGIEKNYAWIHRAQ
jgi:glycosyltransferase involved in cell wall biosynthesis